MKKRIGIYFLTAIGLMNYAKAQNNNSPYSIVGIGDIEQSYFDRTTGMASTGVALSSNRFVYTANPAANAALDFHYFSIETSLRYKSVNYAGSPVLASNGNSSDLQIKKLVIAVKPKNFWAVSLGILPFSSVNYSMFGAKTVQGSNQMVPAYYTGSGGVNNFFFTNSFQAGKHLSLGLQSSFLFGHLNETETITGAVLDSTLTTNRYITVQNVYFKLGAQYKTKVNKNWNASLGATFSNKTNVDALHSVSVTDGNSVLRSDFIYKTTVITLPQIFTGGVAATYKDKYTFVADYTYQPWSNLNYKGVGYDLVNSDRFSLGIEYSKKMNFREFSYEKYFLQAGFFVNNSYLRINGTQISQVGGTFGGGFQTARGLGMQAALEIGTRGTVENGLIRENYTQLTLTFNYRDLWRSKKLIRYD